MNWNKYFDAIWCLDYKPHVFRKREIIKELDRVGILQHSNFKFHETFPSPYDEYLYNHLLNDNKLNKIFSTSPGNMNATFGYYSIFKKSLLDNYNRILIIENDIRFLKDISIIEKTLDNMPNNYDIILFDYFIHCNMTEFNNYKKINEYYSEYENLASTGCHSLTNKAMQILVKLYEQMIYPPDFYLSKINLKGILNKAFTPYALACQCTYKSAMNCKNNLFEIHSMYKKSKLNYDDYNMNNGKKYDYTSFIEEYDNE